MAAFKVYENYGFAIIVVSLSITFLCLPLYIVAEKWQNIERNTIRRLKPRIDSIKAVFKGDEQYMILSAFYRQNNYHPIYGLRTSFGILVQVPFFIAAYSFLSNLELIRGAGFLFIRDLGSPDALLSIGNLKINLLPVLMTFINVISCIIYTKNLSVRDKIQAYGMAAIFLPILYNSPAGLVLYWTMNNFFSLIKNIFYLFKKPAVVLYIILSSVAAFLVVYLLFFHHGNFNKRLVLAAMLLIIPAIPFFIKLFNWIYKHINIDKKFPVFILSFSVVCLLIGFVIPSFVISSSPQEFSYIENIASPFYYLFNTLFQAIGFFIFLPLCIFFMFGDKVKTLLALLGVLLCWGILVNTFLFSGDYGDLSSMLTFSNAGIIQPSFKSAFINLAVLFLFMAIAVFLLIKYPKIINAISIILLLSLGGISIAHSLTISKEYNRLTLIRQSAQNTTAKNSSLMPVFHLSKNQNNVIVINLDRATSAFIPEIFKESPELYEQFTGFTFFPNTISYNGYTIMGIPPLFGGYEYTPKEINARSNTPLVQKHNESLLLMPVIFLNNGFSVTVTDPPWADYSWVPDPRIYAPYPEIAVKNTMRTYTDTWLSRNDFNNINVKNSVLKRNFFWFSLFKASPLAIRDVIYKNGEWWNSDASFTDFILLLNSYAFLDLLPELTGTDAQSAAFALISNDITHEAFYLQAPDYTPGQNITNYGTSIYSNSEFYHVNMAAMKLLGKWLDYLKQNELYDNTRIIISSDHGSNFDSGTFTPNNSIPFNREHYNPLLLLKDFNADGLLEIDNTFMTNADVPVLAFNDLIVNPVNPFTQNPVNNDAKQQKQFISLSSRFMPNQHGTNTFTINSNEWYSIHTDIFNADNWRQEE